MKTRVTKEWDNKAARFVFYVSRWNGEDWCYAPTDEAWVDDWPPFDTQAEAEAFAFALAMNAPKSPYVVVVAEFGE